MYESVQPVISTRVFAGGRMSLQAAKQELERQRKMEWERRRRQELLNQRNQEQEDIVKLKAKKRSLELELEAVVRSRPTTFPRQEQGSASC